MSEMWNEIKLIDHCEKITVGYVGSMAEQYCETGIPFLRSLNIHPFALNLNDLVFINEEFHRKLKKSELNAGDVVLVRTGYPGTACVIPKDLKDANCSDLVIIRPSKELDPHFVAAVFNSSWGKQSVDGSTVGAAQQHFNIGTAKRLKFFAPDFAIQQKIGSIIKNLQLAVEVNNQSIKLLEETARELYKEWFVRMRFPGHKQAKFVKGIPEGWEIRELKSFGYIYTGKTPPTNIRDSYGGNIPFIKTPDMHNSIFVTQTDETLTEKGSDTQKRSALPKGSICVSCIGTGGVVTITTAEKSQTNQQINSLIPAKKISTELLYFSISDLKETIELFGYTGATMTNLSKGKFEKLKIVYPREELVKKYHHVIAPMFEQILNLEKQNIELRQLRDRLLPRLISGKLQVKAESTPAKVISISSTENVALVAEEQSDYKRKKPNPFFQRRVLAAYIIDHLKDEATFGHVKLMKLMYLCEHLAEIETASHYHRAAAGPYDNKMIRSIDSQLKEAQWFECIKTENKYIYKPLVKKGEYKAWFDKYYGEKETGIASLLAIFGKAKTEKAEMVATLYEAWRDLKSKAQLAADDAIMYEVLQNWHESKERIEEPRWRTCLQWMKEKQWIH